MCLRDTAWLGKLGKLGNRLKQDRNTVLSALTLYSFMASLSISDLFSGRREREREREHGGQ